MFTIENFIHGIANVTKSLKASICGDSLIVNRICYDYATRNAVVHSKYGERLRYEPFKHDKHLGKEIPLMRAVAEEIIISSADRINYSFVDPTHSLP